MAKDYVIVNGRVVRMNERAYKIAARHFGATKNRPTPRNIPPELLQMPKLPIIQAVKVEKTEIPKQAENIVVDVPELKKVEPEKAPEVVEVKTTSRRRKK